MDDKDRRTEVAPWVCDAICADCLAEPELEAVRLGLVAVAFVGEPVRCAICGFPFADRTVVNDGECESP